MPRSGRPRAGTFPRPTSRRPSALWAFAYVYDLSKRTSAGLTYASITNEANAMYNLFTNTAAAFGTADSVPAAGEDPRLLAFTVRHAF